MNEKFYLGGYWKGRLINAREYLFESLNFLKSLATVHEAFNDLKIYNETIKKYVSVELSEEFFKTTIFPLLFKDDTWYFKPNGTKDTNLTLDSYSTSGFLKSFCNNADESLSISIFAGQYPEIHESGHIHGHEIPNSVVIKFPDNEWQDLYQLDMLEKLLITTIYHWQPYHALINSYQLREEIHDEEVIKIGYITYFQDKIEIHGLEESFTIKSIDDIGTLYILKNQPFSIESQDCIEKITFLKNSLEKQNLLAW